MKRLLLFGGTTEGRLLAGEAAGMGWLVTLCVATDYGREVAGLTHNSAVVVQVGRMDARQMEAFITQGQYGLVVDATHPYATLATANIQAASAGAGVACLRLQRGDSEHDHRLLYVDSVAEACAMTGEGNVLAATGSKEIAAYATLHDYQNRVYARVLPTEESILLCRRAGLADSHIIAEKGPFTVEQNTRLLRRYSIQTMITKDGGNAGGFEDKLQAAHGCGVRVIAVRRPETVQGLSYRQVVEILEEMGQ